MVISVGRRGSAPVFPSCWRENDGVVKWRGEKEKRLTGGGLVALTASSIGLLDGEAATEGTSDSGVTAADGADIAGGGTDTVEVLGHLNVDGEALSLGLAQTVGTGNVVGHLELDEGGGRVGGDVEVALVGTGTVGIDLVDGDGEVGALLDSRDGFGGNGLLRLTADIDVAIDLSASAGVDDVLLDLAVTDDGRVLLAGGNASAVTGEGVIHCLISESFFGK